MSEINDEGSAVSGEPDAGIDQVAEIKAERKKKEKKRRKSGRSMFGPILLIALGVLLLLSNLDMLPDLNWRALLRLWPLILIFIGLNVIVRQAGRPVGTFFSAMLALAAVAVFGYVLLFADQTPIVGERLSAPTSQPKQQRLTYPAADVQEADVFVDFGAPGGRVYALQDSNELIDAQVSYSGEILFESEVTAGQAAIALESSGIAERSFWSDPFSWFEDVQADPWQVGLASRTPMNLELDLGSGAVDLDLAGVALTGLFVDGGSGPAELALPAGDYDMSYDVGSGATELVLPSSGAHVFTIDGGSGSLTIIVPEEAAVRLVTEGGSGGLNLAGATFEPVGSSDGNEGRWQTRAYEDTADKTELYIDIGSGSVTFEQQ